MSFQKTVLMLVLAFHIITPHFMYAGKWINWGTIVADISSCIEEVIDSIKNMVTDKISIAGTEIIQTKKISISDINTITIKGSALMIITQDNTQSEELTIEADEAVMPYIDVHLHNNELIIAIKKNISYTTTTQNIYRINIKNLLKINASGANTIELKNINTPTVSINLQGSQKISGSLSVNQLNIHATGACNITLSGNALEQNVTISGSSNFYGRNLQGKNMIIEGSGAAHVYSNVSDHIDGNLSGSGSLIYLDSPLVSVQTTKAVSIEKW